MQFIVSSEISFSFARHEKYTHFVTLHQSEGGKNVEKKLYFIADAHAGDPYADPELPSAYPGSDPLPDPLAHPDPGNPNRHDCLKWWTFDSEPCYLPPEPCSWFSR